VVAIPPGIEGRPSRSDGPAVATATRYRAAVPTPTYPLVTDRLDLRPYTKDDLSALHDMFGREDVCRYLRWEPMDLDAARTLLERRVKQVHFGAQGDGILAAAEERATGRMIGEFMLQLTDAESRQGEIGWSLHPDAQGRGFATEGARELIRLGFEELGLHRIEAESDARNAASLRVMERLGMRREAHFIEDEFLKGEWTDSIVCAILESEWRDQAG
jgi:RimJ/RimL family protein N-acetyltransferase